MNDFDNDYAPDAFAVRYSELLVATCEGGDPLISGIVPELLKLLRSHLQMDVVFVSEFVENKRVFRRVEPGSGTGPIEEGQSDPLEQTFCQRVVDGRLPQLVNNSEDFKLQANLPPTPFPVGAHLSTPVILGDGRVYGTLCCFSYAPNYDLTQRDLKKLQMTAQLTARRLDEQRAKDDLKATTGWKLAPLQHYIE